VLDIIIRQILRSTVSCYYRLSLSKQTAINMSMIVARFEALQAAWLKNSFFWEKPLLYVNRFRRFEKL